MPYCKSLRFSGFLILFFLASFSLLAQQQLNLDFEDLSIEGTARPWGWALETYAPNAEMGLDSLHKKNGTYSLRMEGKSEASKEEILTLGYGIEAYQLINNTIQVEGWIKTKDLEGEAFLKIAYALKPDEESELLGEQISQKLTGTKDWTKVNLQLKVPREAKLLYLGVNHLGKGKVWFDHLSLMIEGKAMENVQIAPPLTPKQVNWLAQHSSSLMGVDAGADFEDLEAFGQLVSDAQIIAMGEATHGTSEFFRLKHRVLEYTIKELGVRIFALEDNQLMVEKVNNYVQKGIGKDRSMMYGLFSVWQCEEVFEMIKWIRTYNLDHPDDMVSFVGIDMQNVVDPLDSLFNYLDRTDKVMADSAKVWLSELKANANTTYLATEDTKKEWWKQAKRVLAILKIKEKGGLTLAKTKADSNAFKWGVQYANLVKQFTEGAYKGHLSFYRDEAMAENVSWILSMHPPGTKMLIWAHDNHISRGEHPKKEFNYYSSLSMGHHLAKKYGSNYKAFGLFTYQGAYWAQIDYLNFTSMDCPLYPGPIGSLDEALHQVQQRLGSPGLLLDLSSARQQEWFNQLLPIRFANHVNIEYGYWTRFSIPYQFDGIFFIDKTSGARSYGRK